jgi:hypothetical protein
VAVLTLTVIVVDFPGFFFITPGEGEGEGLAIGLGLTAGLSIGLGLGVLPEAGSVEEGVVPPPVPGVVKSCALGTDIPGMEGIPLPGVEGMPLPPTGVVVVGSWAETAKGRATPTAQHKARINFWGTIAHFSSKKRKYKSAIGVTHSDVYLNGQMTLKVLQKFLRFYWNFKKGDRIDGLLQ